ncbi:hypothetical protein KEM56_001069 [Ascosphaera pollenicola]|nr:hypothetical protein KEM56_001069 [Ascosphaera pollenicola]
MSLDMLPFTQPNPPKTPVPQTPRSSSSTPKNRRALEAYLRVFVRFRVELRKLRQLSKKVIGDEELKQYLNQRKQEVEEDYNVLWEELTERFPDIDMDEIEEEVLIRSLKVPIRISETDLDQLRKNQKKAKQQTEPLDSIQPHTCAREEETASVATTTTSTSRIPLATSTNTAEPPTVTQESSNNEATPKRRKVNAEAPIFSPDSSHSQKNNPSSYTETILGEENLPGRSRSRSSTMASVTPSMASNIFHPGRTTGGVSGLQSEASTFDGYTGQFFNPTTPLPQAPNPFASAENTFPIEQPVFTETPGGLFKPVYPNVQSGVYSPAPQYAVQGKTYPWPANRYTSMPAVFSGHNTYQQQYQGYNSALNTSMPNLSQSQQPAQALQQSKWAAAPAASTPRNKTPAAQLETFTAKLQNRGITLKPSPESSTESKTADHDTAEVSHLTTKMRKLNGLGNGKPNLEPKVSTVKSDENVKEAPFSFSFPKPALKTKLVGLTGSKWAT